MLCRQCGSGAGRVSGPGCCQLSLRGCFSCLVALSSFVAFAASRFVGASVAASIRSGLRCRLASARPPARCRSRLPPSWAPRGAQALFLRELYPEPRPSQDAASGRLGAPAGLRPTPRAACASSAALRLRTKGMRAWPGGRFVPRSAAVVAQPFSASGGRGPPGLFAHSGGQCVRSPRLASAPAFGAARPSLRPRPSPPASPRRVPSRQGALSARSRYPRASLALPCAALRAPWRSPLACSGRGCAASVGRRGPPGPPAQARQGPCSSGPGAQPPQAAASGRVAPPAPGCARAPPACFCPLPRAAGFVPCRLRL